MFLNFYKYISNHKTILISTIMVITFYACSYHLLIPLFNFSPDFNLGDDGGFHIGRIQSLADDIKDGQFPVKMYMSMSAGYGYPAGIMYPDLFLYPFAFLRLLGVPLFTCTCLLVFFINISTILLSFFCAKIIFKKNSIALLFCVLYSINPYRLYCLDIRFAIGELLAIIFLPLILMSMYKLVTFDYNNNKTVRPTKYWIMLSLGFTGVIYSHVLTVVVILIFLTPTVLVILFIKKDIQLLLDLIKAVVLCFALTLAFIVPFIDYFLSYKQDIAYGKIPVEFIVNNEDRANYFSFNDQFRNGWAIYIAYVLWPFIYFKFKNKINKNFKIFGWLLFCMSLAFLLLIKSESFWKLGLSDNIVLSTIVMKLACVQYPWRYYTYMIICLIFLLCICFYILSQNKTKYLQVANLSISIILTFSYFLAFSYTGVIPRANFVNTQQYFDNYVPEADNLYLPSADDIAYQEDFLNTWKPLNEKLDYKNKDVTYGRAWQYSIDLWIEVKNNSSKTTKIDIPRVQYPYVEVYDQKSNKKLSSQIDWWSSFVNVELPENYNGTIYCTFNKPIYWSIGEGVCLIFWFILIIYAVYNYKIKQFKN